jgi:dynein heavy chain 2
MELQALSLMNIDLHRHQQKWKDTMNDIREVFKEAEVYGFNVNNMRAWKAHWDRQLYKALEHQYQLGLESLHQQIPEIRVELIFRFVNLFKSIRYCV